MLWRASNRGLARRKAGNSAAGDRDVTAAEAAQRNIAYEFRRRGVD